MADFYSYSRYPPPQRQSQYCPEVSTHTPCAQTARNKAQYHDLDRLHEGFRNHQHSDSRTSQMVPSPQDPYANLYGYHHYHHEQCSMNRWQMNYPHIRHVYQYGTRDPVAFDGDRLLSYNAGQVQGYIPQNGKLPDNKIDEIRKTAKSFVDACCPLLGEKPYCVPPVKRYRDPDKTNKKLVQGMESEKRVFGSFERYFVERNVPVFMVRNYPLSAFLKVYRSEHLDKALTTATGQSSKSTAMLLLSSNFSVTVLTVSATNGNSQFEHLRHRVLKTASQMKEISSAVSKWLALLGVRSEVRQLIAFPNLKRAVMDRICKDKQLKHNLGSLCTLHLDELSAPFEEEWSDPVHKERFHKWILQNVLCHDATLSQEDLQLVVGALLSPKLSKVDFVQEGKLIMPIPHAIEYADTLESQTENAGQMKLTVDGVTKSFDEFMDKYITCYYPNVEERTYRVPPIHFNIQSLKKPIEYINTIKGDSVLKSITSGSVNKENNNLENLSSAHLSKMNGSDDNTNIIQGVTSKLKSAAQTSNSTGKNSNFTDHGNLTISVVVDSEHGSSSSLQKPGRDSNNLDSLSSRKSPDKHFLSSGIYFKDSPNSSSSLLCADTTINTSHPFVTITSDMRSEFSDSSPSVSPTPTDVTLQSLQDVEILSKVMDKDIRKDEGENRVISALETLGNQSIFGGQQEDPMFIICGYQYNNYLNKLREDMFSKDDAARPVRAFGQTMRAEHDCLIFHKKFGAIIVCIKAIGDNFDEWHATEDQKIACTKTILEKALKQLTREEAMIRHVTSDLPIDLKCHKLIALPNMSRESVKAALWTDLQLKKRIRENLGHEADLFLCSDELPPKNTTLFECADKMVKIRLGTWWKRVKMFLEETGDCEIEVPEYKQLIGRYCGLFSTVEVWSPTNPRMEVRSSSEAVKTCAERFCKFVLLPCQLKALCSNDRLMCLYGPPGSGKTLVLMLKAKEWMLAGKTVALVNSRPGSNKGFPYAYGIYNRLVQIMMEFKIPFNRLYMVNIDSLQYKEDELANIKPFHCVIMDEVSAASHTIIESLCHRQVDSLWCAAVFHDDLPVTGYTFSTLKMDKIIRCPPAVQSVLRHTEEAVRIRKPYEKIYQRNIMEPEPMLNNGNCNKYANYVLKSHIAYCTQLQKGQKHYNKSLTSKYSCFPRVNRVKRLFPNNFSKYMGKNSQVSDYIKSKDYLYCCEPQIEYKLTYEKKDEFYGFSKTGRLYKKKDNDTTSENTISNRLKGKCDSAEMINKSEKMSAQSESADFSTETLQRNNGLLHKEHLDQLSRSFSDCINITEHQNVESESKIKLLDLVIKSLNVIVKKHFNKELQIAEASSDKNQQQQAAGYFTELNSANRSTNVADYSKVITVDTEELRSELLDRRLRQKYGQEPSVTSIGGHGTGDHVIEPNSAKSIAHVVDNSRITTFDTEELRSESVDKRLRQKYDLSIGGHGKGDHVIETNSANSSTKVTDTGKVTILETEEQKYVSESGHKTCAQKHVQECNVTFTGPSKTAQFVSVHGEIKLMGAECLNYDQESLETRLVEKYGKSEISSVGFLSFRYDSEALNKRLMEKYKGRFIDKPKRSSYNKHNIMYVSGGLQNGLPSRSLVLDNKNNNISSSSQDNLKTNSKSNSDFINTRVQKYGRKPEQTSKEELALEQFCCSSNHSEHRLPSDGPQPYIIDHSLHSRAGKPADCPECALKLIEFLNTMIKPEDKPSFQKRKPNFYEAKVSARGSPDNGHILMSNASSVYTKLSKVSFFHKIADIESRTLNWSDVLIVSREMAEDSEIFRVLRSNNIPVEVCLKERAHRIEAAKENKLFITSFKETTGVERAIMIFIPSDRRDSSQTPGAKLQDIDLKLANCINHFSEEDKRALWFVASRSLASLVLILP
ncbi:hypothetical protein BsWGS_18214 [Bradybaena similaris]